MSAAETTAPAVRRVVIAPDSFKGTVTAAEAAAALAQGWLAVHPRDEVLQMPLADGGEGTLEALAAGHRDATWHTLEVSGPGPDRVAARWLELADGTAVVELAQSSGLARMATLHPLDADTRGLGEVIAAVLRTGPRRLVVGLGGSAGTDGGTGCLAALGARFEDHDRRPLGRGGGALVDLARVDLERLPPPPPDGVVCLTDVTAPLLGPDGAAAVFGPQKGASGTEVDRLERGLSRLTTLLGGSPESPGAGAAGGTAYGLQAAWGATTTPGASFVAASTGLPDVLQHASLVVTGEGRFDRTSLSGKVVGHLAELVGGVCPVVVVAGQVAAPPPPGVSSVVSLSDLAGDTAAAQQDPQRWLREAGSLLARAALPAHTDHPPPA